jgi:hypothetical protein
MDIWVEKTAYNIKYWFSNHTSIGRFYSGLLQDNQIHPTIISSLPQEVIYIAAGSEYDDRSCII